MNKTSKRKAFIDWLKSLPREKGDHRTKRDMNRMWRTIEKHH